MVQRLGLPVGLHSRAQHRGGRNVSGCECPGGERSSGCRANIREEVFLVQNGERASSLAVEHADEPALRLPSLEVDREPRRDLDYEDLVPAQ